MPDARLQPFHDSRLPELMSWFPDQASCRTWGGPEFRHPFTATTFREDARVGTLASWALFTGDDVFAGFGQYYLRAGRCHLARLAIAPGFRGRGLGSTLVRELCRRGSAELGVGSYSLFVLPGNDGALRLYQRLGFTTAPCPEPAAGLEEMMYLVASHLPARARQVRPATPADFPAVLALNEESVRFLSPLTPERLASLHRAAALHSVVEQEGRVIAFLLALREKADYDSVNYRWFDQRYPSFLYIDRVVVSQGAQAGGAGSLLYEHAFAHAVASGVPVLAAEFDVEPPNPASARFHARFGFREVGRQAIAGGRKQVSLQVAAARR